MSELIKFIKGLSDEQIRGRPELYDCWYTSGGKKRFLIGQVLQMNRTGRDKTFIYSFLETKYGLKKESP